VRIGRTADVVAGIRLPDTDVASAAERLTRAASGQMLYAHAVRSYLFAALLARHDRMRVDQEALYVGCVLHDIGLTPSYEDPIRAFEHVSADIAAELTVSFGWERERSANLHRAMVLHMAADVAESESPEARALEAGVAFDVTGNRLGHVDERARREVFRRFPRGAFKRDFAALLQREADRKPDSAAAALARLGLFDRIRQAPFEDA
jgi:HD superfamily phosphodiesterase